MERKVKYVEHPVTAEEKQKLVNQGYKIVDARFAPKEEREASKPKAARKRSTTEKSE